MRSENVYRSPSRRSGDKGPLVGSYKDDKEHSGSIKGEKFLGHISNYWLVTPGFFCMGLVSSLCIT
jgi:hypothetical protein